MVGEGEGGREGRIRIVLLCRSWVEGFFLVVVLGVIGWVGWVVQVSAYASFVISGMIALTTHLPSSLSLSPTQPNPPLFHSIIVATYIRRSYPFRLIPTSPHLTSLTNGHLAMLCYAMLCTLHRHSSNLKVVDALYHTIPYHTIPYYIIPDHEVVCFLPWMLSFSLQYNTILYFSRKPWWNGR